MFQLDAVPGVGMADPNPDCGRGWAESRASISLGHGGSAADVSECPTGQTDLIDIDGAGSLTSSFVSKGSFWMGRISPCYKGPMFVGPRKFSQHLPSVIDVSSLLVPC